VDVPELGSHLCGASRPGHFSGVCTVVCKLFNLTLPHWAFFGRKDWQQLVIVRRMARDLDLPVEIVDCPIAREEDGLAMSSRNEYLSPEERREAANISAGLGMARRRAGEGVRDPETLLRELREFYERAVPSGQIDYLQLVDPDELTALESLENGGLLAVAIKVGKARLIDNTLI
jgi:pantoate--beta-alanine ligase